LITVDRIFCELERRGAKLASCVDIDVYTLCDTVPFLRWCTDNGLVLHGSPFLFRILEPRRPVDIARPGRCPSAVYLTDDPAPAMYSAIAIGERGGYSVWRDATGSYTTLEFYVRRACNLAEHGYIYLLSRFAAQDRMDGDYLSYRPVVPIVRLLFPRSDFPHLIRVAEP